MGIEFFRVELYEVEDNRRVIKDITLPKEIKIPFKARQFKIIKLSNEAIEQGLAIGNHYHAEDSGRQELFIAIGEDNVSLFKFKFRKPGQEIQEKEMMAGDACIIPPGYSHSFIGLRPGVKLFGISNLPYDSRNDISDKLF